MATATYPGAGGFTAKTEAGTFIPEIWSDEIIAAYQKNLKMAPLVKKLAMSGKKGDKLHIPKPVRGDANAKAADTAVTIIANTEGELTVTSIDTLSTHVSSKTSLKYKLSTAYVSFTLKTLVTLWLPKLMQTCTLVVLVLVRWCSCVLSGCSAY